MDHISILNQIRSRTNLEKAFFYAFNARWHRDYYYDCFELEYVHMNKATILSELEDELGSIESYSPRPAYAHFPPKNELCYRRMIYIPFKDLVVRYAVAIVLADHLDADLGPRCFANRRSTGEESKEYFLEDFATVSWPAFCKWQKECAENGMYSVLLRTDISAFYDSISHDYLVKSVAEALGVGEDTELMTLFRRILRVPVIGYSHLERKAHLKPTETKQGLPIGSDVDGFLANLYLKDLDQMMNSIPDIEFGRYNDDMRLFGPNRRVVLDAVLILQEMLLAKGLNLNGSKTEIAEDPDEMEALRSKSHEVYFYHTVEEPAENEAEDAQNDETQIQARIDQPFDDFDRQFAADTPLISGADAREFCRFMSSDLLPRNERTPGYVQRLEEVIVRWRGTGKHASWLLVQSAFWGGIPAESKRQAKGLIMRLLQDEQIDSYSRYRIMHHLTRQRGKGTNIYRFLDRVSDDEKASILSMVPAMLKVPAFELNIMALYLLKVAGEDITVLKQMVSDHGLKPIGEPLKNALAHASESGDMPACAADGDTKPDDIPQPY